jgi:hypothetical protein
MEKWQFQVVMVNKWGKAIRLEPRGQAEAWQFDDQKSSDLVTLLQTLGQEGWELVGIDTNVSYAQGPHSYVGSLYIFQRDMQQS